MASQSLTSTPEHVLKVTEVATYLRCEPNTVYGLIRRGELRAVNLGRVLRVPMSAVDEFLAGRSPTAH